MLSRAERQAATVILLLILGVLLILVYLVTNNAQRASADERVRDEQIERGQQLYAANCAVCHGNRGQGLIGLPLNIPANHPTSEAQATQRTEYLTRTITNGRPGTFMPAWGQVNGGPLNEEQINALVTMIEYGDWDKTAQVVAAYQAKNGTPPPPSLSVNTGGIGGNPALVTAGPIPSGVQSQESAASPAPAGTTQAESGSANTQGGGQPATGTQVAAGTGVPGALSSGGTTGGAGVSAGNTPSTINATESDFKIALDKSTVPSGPITFNIKNNGPSPHNVGVVAGNGASKAQGITGNVIKDSETIDQGKTTSITVTLTPGTYQVVCTVPGHVQLGMIVTLTVQ